MQKIVLTTKEEINAKWMKTQPQQRFSIDLFYARNFNDALNGIIYVDKDDVEIVTE